MSLFKVRDFWEARGSDDEEFSGSGAVCYQLIDGLGKYFLSLIAPIPIKINGLNSC